MQISNWYQAANCRPQIAKRLKRQLADYGLDKAVGFTVTESIGDQGTADIDLLLGSVKWAKPADSAICEVEFIHRGQSIHKSQPFEHFDINIECPALKLRKEQSTALKVSSYSGQPAMKQELARLAAFYLLQLLKIEPIS